MKCINCKERDVSIIKRQLCYICYGKLYRKKDSSFNDLTLKQSKYLERKYQHEHELEFVKKYFTHSNWIFQPANFNLGDKKYTPDFYDSVRNVFIEVSGSRQAFHQNKEKYKLLKQKFPKIKFEIRLSNGELLKHPINGKSKIFGETWNN